MHVDAGPTRWYVREPRGQKGRPILFLHGFAGTGADWDLVVNELPSGWRPIVPDLPGHGESPLPPAIGFDKIPSMVEGLMGSLGISRAVFVGYSFGARLALAVATARPKLVEALFLESAHPGLKDPTLVAARRAQDEEDARLLEVDGLDAFLTKWHDRPVFASRRGRPGWTEEVERKRKTNHARRLAVLMRGLGLSAQPDFGSKIAKQDVPMCLVAGHEDTAYVQHAETIAKQNPTGRRLVIAPCGHNVHSEQPLVFRDALHDFLKTLGLDGA